jgi:S-adenosylmethionine:tRNA ribosyltransferase-isomerase
MRTEDFDYRLPKEFIAQTPIEPRDAARLLVLERETGVTRHTHFSDLGQFLAPGDLLVLNETRVIPGRLYGRKIPTGGRVEILLLKRRSELTWEAWVGGKGLSPGKRVELDGGPVVEILTGYEGARRLVKFDQPVEALLAEVGKVPLPPYIRNPIKDPERYQTVYARAPGSAAAPTAGLHFTPGLISRLKEQGVRFAKLTLHIGLDTFSPVDEDDPREHRIHTEWCQIPQKAAEEVNHAHRNGGKIVAVGTTSVRALESAALMAKPGDLIGAFEGPTDLFILPGYTFRAVEALITNFHLPRSTLIMLVSAFAGKERILATYQEAIEEGYRFYSFGDAMLIL